EVLRVRPRQDGDELPPVLAPVVEDLLGRVHQQRNGRVLPLLHGLTLATGASASPWNPPFRRPPPVRARGRPPGHARTSLPRVPTPSVPRRLPAALRPSLARLRTVLGPAALGRATGLGAAGVRTSRSRISLGRAAAGPGAARDAARAALRRSRDLLRRLRLVLLRLVQPDDGRDVLRTRQRRRLRRLRQLLLGLGEPLAEREPLLLALALVGRPRAARRAVEEPQHLPRQRHDQRAVLLRGILHDRLQQPQLERRRVLRHDLRGGGEPLGRLELAVRG